MGGLLDVWQVPVRSSPSSGSGARPGRVLGQDAELIALGIGEGDPAAAIGAEPVKLIETSGGWINLTGLLGLDGGAGFVDPYLGWQGRG